MATKQSVTNQALSIIVPTLNEADNIVALCDRIDASLQADKIPYEIIIIDDHSTDGTLAAAKKSVAAANIRGIRKSGKPGKAYSLLQGFAAAENPLICMIDADLQYPPEAITPMYKLLLRSKSDVVISERYARETHVLRKLSSRVFNLVFARLLFGIRYDTQSGLKLFRKDILKDFQLMPSPWSFDLEFLVRSLENKRKIVSYPIPFAEREMGVTKVKLLSVTYELAKASLVLRASTSIQKVRAGHRLNQQLTSKHSASPFVAGLAIVAICSLLMTSSASALDVSGTDVDLTPIVTTPIITTITDPIVTADPVTTAPVIVTPVTEPVVSTPVTSEPVTQSTSTTTTTTAAAPASNRLQVSSPAASQQITPATAASTTSAEASKIMNDKLAAATATKPYSAYASGYPMGSVSHTARLILSILTKIAIIAGALCLTSFILFKVKGVDTLNKFRKIHSS